MGGRGSSSGMGGGNGRRELGLTETGMRSFVNQTVDFIKRNPRVYGSLTQSREKDFREQITREYNRGFSGLENGRIVDVSSKNPNIYRIKDGDKVVSYRYRQTQSSPSRTYQERNGIVQGYRGEKGTEHKISDMTAAQKRTYLERSVLLKLRPNRY